MLKARFRRFPSPLPCQPAVARAALAPFLVPLAVFLFTLAPSLNFEDAIEFALGGATLGVDHPSGYPLQTLTAHFFTYIPIGDLAGRMNAASATLGALAALFLFLATWELLAPVVAGEGARAAGAWLAAACFAFGRSFWPQAVITEVYALNAAVIAAALWLALAAARAGDGRRWLALVFVAGLGAANHPASLVVTAPLIIWAARGIRRANYAFAAALFLLALGVYLYLPARASRLPPLNWGTPFDAAAFLDHVRRREFGTIYWPRYRYVGFHAVELAKLLVAEYGPGLGVLAAPGLVWLFVKKAPAAKILTFAALVAGPAMLLPLVGLLTPIQVFEIDVWFIPFFVICAPLVGAAAAAFATASARRPVVYKILLPILAFAPLYPVVYNRPGADRRGRTFAAEHSRNLLRTYPYRALKAFPLDEQLGMFEEAYQRFVLGRRPDFLLVDPRNTIRNEMTAVRRAPRFIVSPDAAEAWWLAFRRELTAVNADRPFFYNVADDAGPAWGVACVPFGLSYYAQPLTAPGPPAGRAPWRRYEYRGLTAVERSLARRRAGYEPVAYRIWANYWVAAAGDDFRQGRAEAGRGMVARAARAVGRDAAVAWLVASTYEQYGYAAAAIPLYRRALADAARSRDDALLFRLQYAALLNGLARCLDKAGAYEEARTYREEAAATYEEWRRGGG